MLKQQHYTYVKKTKILIRTGYKDITYSSPNAKALRWQKAIYSKLALGSSVFKPYYKCMTKHDIGSLQSGRRRRTHIGKQESA